MLLRTLGAGEDAARAQLGLAGFAMPPLLVLAYAPGEAPRAHAECYEMPQLLLGQNLDSLREAICEVIALTGAQAGAVVLLARDSPDTLREDGVYALAPGADSLGTGERREQLYVLASDGDQVGAARADIAGTDGERHIDGDVAYLLGHGLVGDLVPVFLTNALKRTQLLVSQN
jgi:hypothetical protein